MQLEKQQLKLDMKQQTGSKLGKEYIKAVLLPCLFNFYAEYLMQNAGLDEAQAGIKIAGRIINNLIYADGTTLMAENKDELKNLLMWAKQESLKNWLEIQLSKTKIMTSNPITSWKIEGGKVEAVTEFIFLGSNITIDGDCSHETKR